MTDRQISALVQAIQSRSAQQPRLLVGIAGPPGSGKSTFAATLAGELDLPASVLPMDGFHLDNDLLHDRGLFHRKGAPETFDAAGFIALVQQLRGQGPVSYPGFDRQADHVIDIGGTIKPETRVVVIEGNYLLLQDAPWAGLADLFDLTVYLDVPRAVLKARLVARWEAHGMARDAAEHRAQGNDMRNVDLVQTSSRKADFTVANIG